jgi:AcrR family transcriptional regulator
MARARTERKEWIEQGFTALAGGGPDAVRIESLARSLGVTKGGFYWHFKDRDALLDELLETWEVELVDRIIERVDASSDDGRSRLEVLFDLATVSSRLAPVELAIRDWARRDGLVARRLRRVDERRMEYLRALFGEICADPADVEARALLAMTLFAGNRLVSVGHNGMRRAAVLERAQQILLT